MKNIVIVGGGYGGLTTLTHLLNEPMPKDAAITLVDRMPYQGLKTEYYALASGTVADVDIRVPFPIHPQLSHQFGEVTQFDLEQNLVYMDNDEPIPYDLLVIALGCTDKFHGIPGAKEHAYGIQSLSDARRAYQVLNDIKPYGQVTVVGGGLSGVELASELRESRPDLNIRIVDRGTSVLSAFPERVQKFVSRWFEEHDVEIKSNVSVTSVEPDVLYNRGNEEILTDVTIWTAGIQPNRIVQQMDLPKDRFGRLLINEYHQLPDYTNCFVVGDCASLPFAPSAQAAESQGKQVAQVIQAMWKGETPTLGTIKLKGVLGSLGKKSGFGVMGEKTMITGRVPRLLKSGVLWISKYHSG